MGLINNIKGEYGELLSKLFLTLFTDGLIIRDVLIDGDNDLTSQIDLIVVGKKGIYVVEVKNYEDAIIYGDGKKRTWYYYRVGKKFDIYSPLMQNKKHIKYLKNFLKAYGDIPFYSVIAILCKDFKIRNINEDPENVDTMVCNSVRALVRAAVEIGKEKPEVFTAEKQDEIYNYIIDNQHKGKQARAVHKEKIAEINNTKKDREKVCPYCNNELIIRKGKYGGFYGCTNYPKCKFTKKLEE